MALSVLFQILSEPLYNVLAIYDVHCAVQSTMHGEDILLYSPCCMGGILSGSLYNPWCMGQLGYLSHCTIHVLWGSYTLVQSMGHETDIPLYSP